MKWSVLILWIVCATILADGSFSCRSGDDEVKINPTTR
jgi:hypothetical protein